MRSYEQLKAWEEIVISSCDEEALLRQITVSNVSGSSTSSGANIKNKNNLLKMIFIFHNKVLKNDVQNNLKIYIVSVQSL